MCSIEEQKLMKQLILDAYPAQKEFYALDVGAGNFQLKLSKASFAPIHAFLPKQAFSSEL